MDKIKYTEKKLKLFAEAQQSIPETYGKNNFNYSMYQSIEQQSIDVLKEYLFHSERFDKNSYEKLHELIENCQKNGSSKLKLLAEQAKKKLEKVYTAQRESPTRQEEKKSVSSKPKKEGSYIEDNICMHMIIGSQLSISNQKIRNVSDEVIKDQTMNCLQDYINAEKLNKDGIRNIKNLIAATKLSRDKELLRMAARAENKLYGSKERVNSSQTVTSKKHTSIGTKLKNILKKCKEVIVKHIKKIAIIGGIGLTGLVAGKYGKDIAKTFQNAKENKTEMYTTPIVQQEAKTKSITPQMVSQAQKQEKSQVKTTEMSKLEKAYKKVLSIDYNSEYEYLDYLKACVRLEYDMKNSRVLYPKNLKEAHDKAINLLKLVLNESNDKLIKERAKLLDKFTYNDKKYVVFAANSVESLLDESKQQNNCVKTYIDDYALAETDIYFMREIEHKEKSLVTIEVKNNRVVQCRIKDNYLPNNEQMNFINKWAKNKMIYSNNSYIR